MTKPIMKCGHRANGIDGNGNHVCVVCSGLKEGWNIPVNEQPNLVGRKAKCDECGRITNSKENLPFFKYISDEKFDVYYCGCRGFE